MTYKSEQVNLLGVQSVLMPLIIIIIHVTMAQVAIISVSTSVALVSSIIMIRIIIQEWHVKGSTDPGFYFLYCGMWKLYYVFPPGYITRPISSWYNTISKKSAGN